MIAAAEESGRKAGISVRVLDTATSDSQAHDIQKSTLEYLRQRPDTDAIMTAASILTHSGEDTGRRQRTRPGSVTRQLSPQVNSGSPQPDRRATERGEAGAESPEHGRDAAGSEDQAT